MSVFFINLSLFSESCTALLAAVFFVLFMSEFRSRHQTHLLYAAGAFLAGSAAYLAAFLGSLSAPTQNLAWGCMLAVTHEIGFSIACLLISLAMVQALDDQSHLSRVRWAVAALPLASIILSLYTHFFAGTPCPVGSDISLQHFLLDNAGAFSTAAALITIGAFGARPGAKRGRILKYLLNSGAIFLGALTIRMAGAYLELPWLCISSVLVQLVGAAYWALAFLALGHPDRRIVEEPTVFFRRRLLYKAAGLNALLFLFSAYLLVMVMSSYFVRNESIQIERGLRRDTHVFSRTYASNAELFLEETARLAADPEVSRLAADPSAVPSARISEFIAVGATTSRIMRVVGPDGKVIYSSYSPKEVGTTIDSALLRKALGGRRVAATEQDEALRRWVLRAAVPRVMPDGTVDGVIMTTDLSAALDFRDYTDISPIFASGYGYVTETGENAYSVGENVDLYTQDAMRGMLAAKISLSGTLASGDRVFLERAFATDGAPNGFFYILLRRALLEGETVRVLGAVMLIMHLALLLVLSVMIFVIALVLRPLRALRAAADLASQGRFDQRVGYTSPDEVGELAAAYDRMGAAIVERNAQLRQAAREQQDFLEHAIGDLRNPINAFRWTLEMMRYGDTGKLTRQQMEFLEQMHQSNERLTRMVQNMRDMMRLDRGEYVLRPEFFSIEDLIDEVAGDFSVAARQKNLDFHWKRSRPALPKARADRTAVKKILAVYVGNAIKYTQPHGHVKVVAARSANGPSLSIGVEDSGRGIPAEEQSRIFTRFFRTRASVADEVEGSGLGLYVAKTLTELQGGKTWFESKENVGTTFSFTVPADSNAKD